MVIRIGHNDILLRAQTEAVRRVKLTLARSQLAKLTPYLHRTDLVRSYHRAADRLAGGVRYRLQTVNVLGRGQDGWRGCGHGTESVQYRVGECESGRVQTGRCSTSQDHCAIGYIWKSTGREIYSKWINRTQCFVYCIFHCTNTISPSHNTNIILCKYYK